MNSSKSGPDVSTTWFSPTEEMLVLTTRAKADEWILFNHEFSGEFLYFNSSHIVFITFFILIFLVNPLSELINCEGNTRRHAIRKLERARKPVIPWSFQTTNSAKACIGFTGKS